MKPPITHLGEIALTTTTSRKLRHKISPYIPAMYELVLRKNRTDALVALQGNILTIMPGEHKRVLEKNIFRETAPAITVQLTDEQLFKIRYQDNDGIYQWNRPALRDLVNTHLGEE